MHTRVLAHFKKKDQIIYTLLQNYSHEIKIKSSTDYFFSLVESIISQQLSLKAANTIINRFIALFDNETITASSLIAQKDQDLRNVGMSWSKVSYIKNIAKAVQDKELDFVLLEHLKDEEVIKILTKIKGIGVWTAEMFLIFSMGREDVFSATDIGLQNAIKNNYKLSEKPKQEYIKELSSKWKPYRSYAALALWQSLNNSNF